MQLMAPRDVARRLKISVSRVAQLDRDDQLPAMRDMSGRRIYDADAVERFALTRDRRAQELAR